MVLNLSKANTSNIIASSIIENIHSQRYFEDAREWYCFKYLGLYRQTFVLLILNILTVLSFTITVFNIYMLLPMTSSQVFTSVTKNSLNKVPVLKKLNYHGNHNIEKTLAKYFITYYITTRESYNYSNLEKQNNIISNLSSPIVSLEYQNIIKSWNNSNKEFLYKTSRTAIANVEDVVFLPYDNFLDSAQVIYTVTVKSSNGEVLDTQKFQAQIKFYIPNIQDVIDKRTNFNFAVTRYETQKLQ